MANVCGCREVMRYTECDVSYDWLWEDRWAAESQEQRCVHLGESFHDVGLAMYTIVFAEVLKIKEWFFFSYFFDRKSTKLGEGIGPTSWKQGRMLGFGNQILKVDLNAGYFFRREE